MTNKSKKPQYTVLTLGIVALLLALSLVFSASFWQPLENATYDLRLKILARTRAASVKPTGTVVVVGLEEATVVREKPLIFWYPDIGKFLEKMHRYGVFSVGIDMIPVHALGRNLENSIRSLEEFKATPENIKLLADIGEMVDRSLVNSLLKVTKDMHVVQGAAHGVLPFYYSYLAFMDKAYPASVRLTVDKDMVLRKQNTESMDGLESFAHMQYKLRTGTEVPYESTYVDYRFAGKVPYYSFEDVMSGKVRADAFKGKTVLLGYISGYDDSHPTPLGKQMDGVMIHALVLETMLRGGFIKATGGTGILLLSTALMMAAAVACAYWMRPLWAIISSAAIMAGYALLSLLLMSKGYLLSIFPQEFGPASVFLVYYPYLYVTEQRVKRRLYKTFSYYFDTQFIDTILEKDVESLLKGEEYDLCILFSDIRDFTGHCRNSSPHDIIMLLNRYFSMITTSVKQHGGFVNKFLGDGVLAFFGGPNAVQNAIAASEDIMTRLRKFQSEASSIQGIPFSNIRIGIGIDYGPVVMGNVGSEEKMDFTIIGANVNRAARIEGLTKQLRVMFLMSDDARQRVSDPEIEFEDMGKHMLKGISSAVHVHTLKSNISESKGGQHEQI